jgi:succinyl-CoA:acetate CoA-transferase
MTDDVVTDRIGDVPTRTAEQAAASIPADATVAVSGFGSVGYPKAVPGALAASDRDLALSLVSGGSVGDEIDTDLVEAGAIARRYPFQATSAARQAVNDGEIAFHDSHVQHLADEVELGSGFDVDVAVVEAVAVGADWLVPSLSIGPTPAYVAAADELIVEVNEAVPLALQHVHDVYRPAPPPRREPIPLSTPGERIGSPRITFAPEKLTAVVRSSGRDTGYTFRQSTAADEAIAEHLVDFLSREIETNPVFAEQLNLQFGVGSLGNALMGELGAICETDRTVTYFGEVIQDGLLDLLDAGKLGAASATSLALSREGQDSLIADVEDYAESIVLRPSDVSNNPALVDRFGVVAVNSALEVDVYGHVNSTHVDGRDVINGIGGSGDFTRNAHLSIVALPATAAGGDVSRVVPMVPHVDHTEHDVDAFVTEHGVADLRGCSPRERADAVVEHCAAPSVRPALRDYLADAADQGGHEPHDLDRAFDWAGE